MNSSRVRRPSDIYDRQSLTSGEIMLIRKASLVLAFVFITIAHATYAQVFGTVRVSARDSQGLAVAKADVILQAEASAWKQMTTTNAQGEAVFAAVPIGHYSVTVVAAGFTPGARDIQVTSNSVVPVEIALAVEGVKEEVKVEGVADTI